MKCVCKAKAISNKSNDFARSNAVKKHMGKLGKWKKLLKSGKIQGKSFATNLRYLVFFLNSEGACPRPPKMFSNLQSKCQLGQGKVNQSS